MKKIILLLTTILISTATLMAQDGINYQAVVRNASGDVVQNGTANLTFEILDNSSSVIWSDNSSDNINNGVINTVIGQGSASFLSIDWSQSDLQLSVEIDVPAISVTLTDTQSIQYVPYALYSETALNVINDAVDDADSNPTNEIQSLSLSNGTLSISTSGQSSVDMPWTENGNLIYPTDFSNASVSIGTDQVTTQSNVDLMVEGFTKLGGDNTPGIQTKWVDGTNVSGSNTIVPLGVNASEIVSLSVHINVGGQLIPPNSGNTWDLGDTYAYGYDVSGSSLRIRTDTGTSTNNLNGSPIQVYIIYKSN